MLVLWYTYLVHCQYQYHVLISWEKQVWDLLEGKHLFYGNDPDGKGYSTRAHLAEVMGILGPPPLDMLQCGKRSNELFSTDGKSSTYHPLAKCILQRLIKTNLQGNGSKT